MYLEPGVAAFPRAIAGGGERGEWTRIFSVTRVQLEKQYHIILIFCRMISFSKPTNTPI